MREQAVRDVQRRARRIKRYLFSACSAISALTVVITAQSAPKWKSATPINDRPNPYRRDANWAQLPAGLKWGAVIGAEPGPDGRPRRPNDRTIRAVRLEIGMVFQRFNLFPHMTVLENVIEGPVRVKKVPRDQAVATAEKYLDKVGLRDKRDEHGNETRDQRPDDRDEGADEDQRRQCGGHRDTQDQRHDEHTNTVEQRDQNCCPHVRR